MVEWLTEPCARQCCAPCMNVQRKIKFVYNSLPCRKREKETAASRTSAGIESLGFFPTWNPSSLENLLLPALQSYLNNALPLLSAHFPQSVRTAPASRKIKAPNLRLMLVLKHKHWAEDRWQCQAISILLLNSSCYNGGTIVWKRKNISPSQMRH